MARRIALVTVLTNQVSEMVRFYRDVLGFGVASDSGEYVEMENEGVRFAICSRGEMERATHDPSFSAARGGQSFELAFAEASAEDVERAYAAVVVGGARGVAGPATMPWGQRTAYFADPDGNIHELFAEAAAGDGNEGSAS